MAQAGSPQGLRLPVSGRGWGSGGFSRSGKPRLLLNLIPVGRSFPTRPSFSFFFTWKYIFNHSMFYFNIIMSINFSSCVAWKIHIS